MTKYAEWVTQSCGCRWLIDIGTIMEKDDTDCTTDHTPRHCTVCGELTEPQTIAHGTLLTGTHRVELEETNR